MTELTSLGGADQTQGPPGGAGIRCLLAMLGVDCHSKGLRTLGRLLRDRGVEVIYLGEHNTADGVAEAVLAEDPDVLGISFSTSTYRHHVGELVAALRRHEVEDTPLIIGGLIHQDDHEALKEAGVAAIFGPGTSIDDVMLFMQSTRRGVTPDRGYPSS